MQDVYCRRDQTEKDLQGWMESVLERIELLSMHEYSRINHDGTEDPAQYGPERKAKAANG